MKNILKFAIMGLIALGMNACDPMEDIYDDLPNDDSTNLANINKMPAVDTYTLTESDYALSSNDSIALKKFFSALYPASEYLPEIINTLFLVEAGAEMTVTYNFNNPFDYGNVVEYTLDSADYDNDYANFSNATSVKNFATDNYTGERGDLVYLTYRFRHSGITDTVTSPVVNTNGSNWEVAYQLTSADYTAMGQSYANFSDEEVAKYRLAIYLEDLATKVLNFKYAEVGTSAYIVYDFYSGGSSKKLMQLTLGTNGWEAIESTYPKSSSFTSGSSSWNIVPPIAFIETTTEHTREYTLTEDDYALVGNGNYDNFEESLAIVIDKISTILKSNFTDLTVGDIFLVHYRYYIGGGVTEDRSILLQAVASE